ncbi:MAG: CBS domain-containing protein [bacterium]
MLKVSEMMTKDVITVSPEMSVRDAARKLFEMKISGLPVVDEQKNVLGMITEKDIIAMALPKYVEKMGDFDFLLNVEPFARKFEESDKIMVKDVMRKDVLCVTEEVPVPEVARLMIVKKIRRIPILNKDKKLVGIIARADIVKEIAKKIGVI